ncbi:hypothetical protein [Dechloromonas sp. HYN0024]|uniref:hypothetical protein n=1 Tax=Dechloromonas sp. HYN0024 TaxID=2231055 RepID=UPI000E43E2E3|nr:hypothetical protein [Dechloromonas sp. HYN0024]AXS81043.1 hypothetical protein HYN24_14020 [Dechloromonas sp. HYN0024]
MSVPFHLDFVRSRRPAGMPGIILLVAGIVALSGIVAYDLADLQPTQEALQQKVAESQQLLNARHPEPPKGELARFESDRKEADKASMALNRPWKALLDTLESLADRPVALLTLEPDAIKGEIALSAEARNLEAMSAYYRDIQRLDGFSEVVLRTHQTNFQDPDKPVRFRITLKWNVQP